MPIFDLKLNTNKLTPSSFIHLNYYQSAFMSMKLLNEGLSITEAIRYAATFNNYYPRLFK